MSAHLPVSEQKLSQFRAATAQDNELKLLMKAVKVQVGRGKLAKFQLK